MALYYYPLREAEAESSTFRGRGASRVGAEESIEHTARIICGHPHAAAAVNHSQSSPDADGDTFPSGDAALRQIVRQSLTRLWRSGRHQPMLRHG
jgi:hypothetical protein